MKKIAITGSYAVGKTSILSILKEMGYPTFDSDVYVGKLYQDVKFQNRIVQEVNDLDEFDREKLSKILYSNKQERKKVESIIHPMVMKEISDFAENNSNKDLVFCEVPLLFEVGLTHEFDISICIYCSEDIRLERAKKKKNFSQDKFDKLSEIQLDQEAKKKYADYVIDSNQEIEQLRVYINKLIEEINNV